MTVSFHTLGCKVNQYESEALLEEFLKRGFSLSDSVVSDVTIINSCTVTAESDRKTRQLLRRCRRENPNGVIVLTGCMAQAFPESAYNLTEADVIIGNKDVLATVNAAEEFLKTKRRILAVEDHRIGEGYITPPISGFSERTRAFMKIEDGCERYCTYCTIPKARGFVRSRALEDIASEAKRLSEAGFREIVLVGINLSAYGKDCEFGLCDAVDAAAKPEGIKRVRLGSLEPDHISDRMLARFKAQEKFCPQFHLSLQSGCDETLKRMNRKYDSAFYFDLISRIRKVFPDASITTDIMVGFAGETEEEFSQSLSFAKKAGFARAHIFMYSRREGTVAARLPNQVSEQDKKQRAARMAAVTAEGEAEFLKSQCQKSFPVLFESEKDGIFEGYTPNYTKVLLKSELSLSGKVRNIKITEAKEDFCLGELI